MKNLLHSSEVEATARMDRRRAIEEDIFDILSPDFNLFKNLHRFSPDPPQMHETDQKKQPNRGENVN